MIFPVQTLCILKCHETFPFFDGEMKVSVISTFSFFYSILYNRSKHCFVEEMLPCIIRWWYWSLHCAGLAVNIYYARQYGQEQTVWELGTDFQIVLSRLHNVVVGTEDRGISPSGDTGENDVASSPEGSDGKSDTVWYSSLAWPSTFTSSSLLPSSSVFQSIIHYSCSRFNGCIISLLARHFEFRWGFHIQVQNFHVMAWIDAYAKMIPSKFKNESIQTESAAKIWRTFVVWYL